MRVPEPALGDGGRGAALHPFLERGSDALNHVDDVDQSGCIDFDHRAQSERLLFVLVFIEAMIFQQAQESVEEVMIDTLACCAGCACRMIHPLEGF